MSDKTSDKKASDKLLNCPFCGGEAEFYRTPVKSNGRWCDSVVVCCKNCEARTNMVLYDAKKHPNDEEYDEAAVAWNQRKPMERIVERLKNKINPLHNVNWNSAMEKAIEIVKEEGGV